MSFIREFVEEHYHQWGIEEPSDISLHLWNNIENISVTYRKGPTTSVDAKTTRHVFCNKSPLPFRRVEIAHEIGHAVFHAGHQLELDESTRQEQEKEADIFSMEALIPSFMLETIFRDTELGRGQAEQYIAELFGVPLPFAARRLDYFCGELNRSLCSVCDEPEHDLVLRDPLERDTEYLMWNTGEVAGFKKRSPLS